MVNTQVGYTYNLFGVLEMPDSLEYEYILKNEDQKTNLTNMLNNIYYSPTYQPIVKVEILKNGRHKFNEEGFLELRKEMLSESEGLFVFHINGRSIDKVLFENSNCNKELNIIITYMGEKETEF